jgi:Tol biopolymer transport system component
MKKTILFLSLLAACTGAFAQDAPLWLRKNQISPDGKSIAFSYKGNIYVVDSKGGEAKQLTSNPAYDSDPMWTADSKTIVFSSYREKGKDVFSMPVGGGVPKQLTNYAGDETPLAVLNDGRVLFSANIQIDPVYDGLANNPQLYIVGPKGGIVEQVTSLPIGNISVN